VVFCVDVSGSMCVTTEVPQLQAEWLKAQKMDTQSNNTSLNPEGFDQFLPGQRRNTTYVSRLQCVKAAIDTHLDRLQKQPVDKRVVLITFNNEVTVFGDGAITPEVVTGDKLSEYNALLGLGSNYKVNSLKSIKESKPALSDIVHKLQEGGSTALGPSLLIGIGIASQSPGSEIIVCTDGASNVGVGSLDNLTTNKQIDAAKDFYKSLGLEAKKNNTTISIIGIEGGGDMGLEAVGKAASVTSGTINIVNPLELVRQVRSIYQNSVVATGVKVSILMSQNCAFRAESLPDDEEIQESLTDSASSTPSSERSEEKHKHKHKHRKHKEKGKQKVVAATTSGTRAMRYIGNVTSESDITFEFHTPNVQLNSKPVTLPFQIQITYTKPSGWKNVRIISKQREITTDRVSVEKNSELAIIGLNAVKTAANLAQSGDIKAARNKLFAVQHMMKRGAQSDTQMEEYYNYISVSAELDEELKRVETSKSSDTTAKILYRMKGASKTAFLAGAKKKEAVVKRKVKVEMQEKVHRFGTVEQSY